jgi:hypothetical protein
MTLPIMGKRLGTRARTQEPKLAAVIEIGLKAEVMTQHVIQIASAAVSLAGVCILYKFSGVGGIGGYVNAEIVEQARKAGGRSLWWQRIGLALSILGIAMGVASSFA